MFEYFFTRIEDPEMGIYYWPTGLGFTAIAIAMILLLLLAVMLTSAKGIRMKTQDLVYCALSMALAFVTSTFFKIIPLPMGGSITLFSMLFISQIGYWYGLRTGLTAAIAYGLLQLVSDPWILSVPQVLFDYIFAFGSLGLSGLFYKSKHGLIKGYLFGITMRFVFSFLSGIIFFASYAAEWNLSVPVYSLLYNGSYVYGEGIMTLLLIAIPAVNTALARIKKQATAQ